jgi:hypothetical protein
MTWSPSGSGSRTRSRDSRLNQLSAMISFSAWADRRECREIPLAPGSAPACASASPAPSAAPNWSPWMSRTSRTALRDTRSQRGTYALRRHVSNECRIRAMAAFPHGIISAGTTASAKVLLTICYSVKAADDDRAFCSGDKRCSSP